MPSFSGSFRLDYVRLWFVAVVLACPTAIPTIAQTDTDPFNGQPAAGAAGMRTPDLPSGESIQRPSAEKGNLVFRSQTEIVEVPAIVTDKSGHALHGLTKDDFRVFEDGKEHRIATFEEVNAAANVLAVRSTSPGQFSNISEQTREPQSVVVIVLDTINTPFLDQAYARWEVLRYLANNSLVQRTLGLVVIGEKGGSSLMRLGN